MLLARERSRKDATLTQGRTALAGEIFLREALKIGRDYAVKYRIAFRRRSCAAPMRYTCRLLEIPPRRRNRGANPRELERFSSRKQEKRKKIDKNEKRLRKRVRALFRHRALAEFSRRARDNYFGLSLPGFSRGCK